MISAILNLSQAGPAWPLHILDHTGRSHTVTLQEGELLWYESAKCELSLSYQSWSFKIESKKLQIYECQLEKNNFFILKNIFSCLYNTSRQCFDVSVEHGRPERFTGSHYDNVFIHYKEAVPDIATAW